MLTKKGMCMKPLVFAEIGEENTILKICGDSDIKEHLKKLGFYVGGAVTIVKYLGGDLIVTVKDSRIALDESMARNIMI